MNKLEKRSNGLLFIGVGFLFSILGMTILTGEENRNLLLTSLILSFFNILYGIFRIYKAIKN